MEERQAAILKTVNEKQTVSVSELTELLGISESTVRRDLIVLNNLGRLIKVHGGAAALNAVYDNNEEDFVQKSKINVDEKKRIAYRASLLIKSGDLVYIDAGTTTGFLAEYIKTNNVFFVTNGIFLARRLASKGACVNIISGRIRHKTEAVVGGDAILSIQKYNFNVGFFGVNGIDSLNGYTTPDIDEAAIKTAAAGRCKSKYILADSSKFNKITAVSFGKIDEFSIITSFSADSKYKKITDVLEADKQ